jgi:hypothetical protein
MENEYVINREAFEDVHCREFKTRMDAAVATGEWTAGEASAALDQFRRSKVLQQLVDLDAERAVALLEGRVH